MKNRIVSLGQYEDALFCYDEFLKSSNRDAEQQTLNAKRAIVMAINEELTARQREILLLYYFEGKSMVEIAKMLGINKSSVSRLISRAKLRIEKVLKYNFR